MAVAAQPQRAAALPSFETLRGALVDGGVEARLATCATNDGLVRLWDIRTTTVIASSTTDVRATVLAVADTGPFAVVAGDASGAVHLLELVSPG
jgi:hypothetical protein